MKVINFSNISSKSLIGFLLRLPLKLLPKNLVVPVIQGEIKGYKWIVGSGVNGYWLGSYELEKVLLFSKLIKEKGIKVVYDIGANVGYYTLISSKLVGSTGKVYAFEPNPRNVFYLKKHIEMNRIENTTIVEAAVCDKCGLIRFDNTLDSSMGKISDKGIDVQSLTIDDFVFEQNNLPPELMKFDIEGAEYDAFIGAEKTITKFHPVLFLAAHSDDLLSECLNFIKKHSYIITEIQKYEIVAY